MMKIATKTTTLRCDRLARLCAGLLVATSVLGMTGCVVAVGNRGSSTPTRVRTISGGEMSTLLAANREARLGMRRTEALQVYPAELITLRENRRLRDAELHIYQIRAQERSGSATFERWLYFIDDRLVELSDARLDLDQTERIDVWFGE